MLNKIIGIGLPAVATVRGALDANKYTHQVANQMELMKEDPSLPIAKFSSKLANERFEKFANERFKLPSSTTLGGNVGQSLLHMFGSSATDVLAKKLIENPLNKAFDILKAKLYIEPKQQNVLKQVIQTDPTLAQAMEKTPDMVIGAYKTLKQFAPSLTTDANSLKNFLKQAIIMNGQIDFNTIKLLAETEKTIRQFKGEIGGK